MSSLLLHFPPFRLDPSNERLWRETVEIPLRPKTFAVLRYLVEHPEQLVTKEELLNAVWAETVVGEDALTGCIRDLRKVLGDEAKRPQYIETVHRRGFRFLGEVVSGQEAVSSEEVVSSQYSVDSREEQFISTSQTRNSSPQLDQTPDPEPQPLEASTLPARRSWSVGSLMVMGLVLLVGVILTVQYLSRPTLSTQHSELGTQQAPQALPLPDKPSIIVLPLVNLSNDPEQDYFSDGLTEALTGDLSRIYGLFVIARNSAFTYKGKAVNVQDVSKEMGVRYVLEGSVQKADQQIRITTQLIDATTGYHLWSQQYDRPLKDIFALQDEIVQKIVTTLRLQLSVREQGFLVRKTTDNLEAYDTYLRGLEYFLRFTKEANAQARQMYEHAVALDPAYAEAYIGLGWTYGMEWIWQWSSNPQNLERAFELARQALALDDTLSGATAVKIILAC